MKDSCFNHHTDVKINRLNYFKFIYKKHRSPQRSGVQPAHEESRQSGDFPQNTNGHQGQQLVRLRNLAGEEGEAEFEVGVQEATQQHRSSDDNH